MILLRILVLSSRRAVSLLMVMNIGNPAVEKGLGRFTVWAVVIATAQQRGRVDARQQQALHVEVEVGRRVSGGVPRWRRPYAKVP